MYHWVADRDVADTERFRFTYPGNCFRFATSTPLLLNACSTQTTSVSATGGHPGPPSRCEHLTQSDASSFPAPAPNAFIDGDLGIVEGTPPPGGANNTSEPPLNSDSGKQALHRLVSQAVLQDELPSVVETIVSTMKAASIVEFLEEGDAQTFVDVIDEARRRTIPALMNFFIDPHFRLPGFGPPQPLTTNPKEMCEILVQDMCWSYLGSEITACQSARGSGGRCAVSGWVWGRVEA